MVCLNFGQQEQYPYPVMVHNLDTVLPLYKLNASSYTLRLINAGTNVTGVDGFMGLILKPQLCN